MLIGERLATKPNFRKYSYTEEMQGDGNLACIRYIDNFNPEKSQNPFAYFTQIMVHAFVGRLNTEQKQQYVKARLMKDVTEVATELGIDNMDSEVTDSDPTNNVIEAFERRMADRKAKAAKNKA
jgi:DNA-directed RNA polymerase specialized sigma24 family protein